MMRWFLAGVVVMLAMGNIGRGQVSGDLNGDDKVTLGDVAMLAEQWGADGAIAGHEAAGAPAPADGATGTDSQSVLRWTAGYGSLRHRIYLGTAIGLGAGDFRGEQYESSYAPGGLASYTTYFWRVDEVTRGGVAPGPVWHFTTGTCNGPGAASGPNPADGASKVALRRLLRWTAGSGATRHDVYFGTAQPLGTGNLVGSPVGTSWDTGLLEPNTTYYWRIDEGNACTTTTGAVWQFTTGGGGTIQTWDLAGDWSDTANPNGAWSYRDDTGVAMPHQSATVGLGPAGWATTTSAPPSLFKPAVPWYDFDIPVGRVGGHGPWRVRWVSPIDGEIVISGDIWQLFEPTRIMSWSLAQNGAVFTTGTVTYGQASSGAPLSFASGSGGVAALTQTVATGDVIEFRVWAATTTNTFVGTDLTITGSSSTPVGGSYDVAADWSDASNPNGVWSYGGGNSGVFDLLSMHQAAWLPEDLGANQPAWADTASGIPGWCLGTGLSQWNFPAGQVGCHSPTMLRWTAPTTGQVEVGGGLWLMRNWNRNQNWQLRVNGTAVTSGLLPWGPNSGNPLNLGTGSGGTEALLQTVAAGDTVELYLYPAAGTGDFVGVAMWVNYF
jgi:hypothetical protein